MLKLLPKKKIVENLKKLSGWHLSRDGRSIRINYLMKDFISAVQLVRVIAVQAEKLDHHPDLHLTGYRHLRIELSTHSAGGLTRKDFLLAGKIQSLPKKLKTML